jgi:hypothetical protein
MHSMQVESTTSCDGTVNATPDKIEPVATPDDSVAA